MFKRSLLIGGVAIALAAGQVNAQSTRDSATQSALTCADLNWSAQVLEQNPDIAQTCRSVYEKDGKLYAYAKIEVVRTRGNTITYRTIHVDGTKGDSRSVTVGDDWRARIEGREFRARELMRGQELNVYLPEDRFAIAVQDDDGITDDDWHDVETASAMPTTASPLFLIGLAGAAFAALGGALSMVRRRMS